MRNAFRQLFYRSALSTYLSQEAKTIAITPKPTTIPVKYNVKIRNRPYQAIVDSEASISIIAYKVVQELGLKIEQTLTSLIISAIGTSS